jgi:GxxExxY protein
MSVRVHSFERFTTKNTEHHEDARSASVLTHRDLSNRIIGSAIEVCRNVGPGFVESVYTECLSDELGQREVAVPVTYKGKTLPLGFRADILVGNTTLVEIKAVVAPLPTHDAQILTYLRMSQIPVGLQMNFHTIRLKDGLRRFVI